MLELINTATRVRIDPEHGGRLGSLEVFGQQLLVDDDPDPLGWGCYAMAPWVGRTRHGRFTFGGSDYELPITLPPHAIHGTVWNRPWTTVATNTLRIDLGADWPFGGFAEQTFTLTEGGLTLRLSVNAAVQKGPHRRSEFGWPFELDKMTTFRECHDIGIR